MTSFGKLRITAQLKKAEGENVDFSHRKLSILSSTHRQRQKQFRILKGESPNEDLDPVLVPLSKSPELAPRWKTNWNRSTNALSYKPMFQN